MLDLRLITYDLKLRERMKVFTFLGLPASGKGTQATMLAEKINATIICGGDMVRAEIENCDLKDPFCKSIKDRYDEGTPQPDDIMADLVKKNLQNTKQNIIFDNYPFNKVQAENFKNIISEMKIENPTLVVIEISPEEAIKRITLRRVCSDCGAIFNDQDLEMCSKCQGPLISRADDNEETVKKRIKKYAPSINEVKNEYPKFGKVVIVNGEQSIEDVSKELLKKVDDGSTE